MRTILVAIVLLLCAPLARADAIARQGSNWVRLTALLCKSEPVQERIKALGRDPLDFRAASARFEGKDYAGCWIPRGGAAHVIYEDGDQGLIPLEDLKPAPEA
jgi:hypothetical protein